MGVFVPVDVLLTEAYVLVRSRGNFNLSAGQEFMRHTSSLDVCGVTTYADGSLQVLEKLTLGTSFLILGQLPLDGKDL